EGLFLLFLASKVIVVGDDQQISPPVGFVRDELIRSLQNRYLRGLPHLHLLATGKSLYDHAKVRFEGRVNLREHFRCVPEIIEFSNRLCYAAHGTPLDPLKPVPPGRLEPLVPIYVESGYVEGDTRNRQNRPEAESVVAHIKACCEDPRYAGKTMGVISLLGEQQARLIESLLVQHVGCEEIERRDLACGDAYAFQGDERDIIFLSLVVARNEIIGALAKESDKQRFNVAASRAKEQLWLFHSVRIDELRSGCVRRELLSYVYNPALGQVDESELKFDSEFERDVFERIRARGYRVRTQVAVGDGRSHRYRIDLV